MDENIFAPGLFEDRVILVTGAAGGVGSAVADLLSSLGARLALTDYKETVLDRAGAPHAVGILADIRSVSECAHIIRKTLNKFGRLDALVNCAGIWVKGRNHTTGDENIMSHWRAILQKGYARRLRPPARKMGLQPSKTPPAAQTD